MVEITVSNETTLRSPKWISFSCAAILVAAVS